MAGEEAIAAIIKLLRGRPEGNQVELHQTIAPAEVYAQALAAVIAAWNTASSVEVGPSTTYVVDPGVVDFHFYNSSGVADKSVVIAVYMDGAWRTTYIHTLTPGDSISNGPWVCDGVNVRVVTPADVYCRIVKVT